MENTSNVRANTCASFYSKINEYFEAGKYTDVSITCQDRVFKCHRLTLAAACQYFDIMFSGSFKESYIPDVVLHDIDSSTFESALHYIYNGSVPIIDDENVYHLLRAASVLTLDCIEEQCIHYLTQKNVPKDYALEIFLYAYVTKNESLLHCTSECILKYLDHFSTKDIFLQMSVEELSTLLQFTSFGSKKKEYIVLKAICQWVCNLEGSLEEKNASFLKLTKDLRFRKVPVGLFDGNNDKHLEPNWDGDSRMNNLDSSIHVYINSVIEDPETHNWQTSIFTMEEAKISPIWHLGLNKIPIMDFMRTIEFENRLYNLQLQSRQFKFISTSSIDFSLDTHILSTPPLLSNYGPFSICSHKNGIYACDRYYGKDFLNYNCELDKWFPISFTKNKNFSPTLITLYHNHLYMIGSDENNSSYSKTLHAYDDRTGKLQVLSTCKLPHSKYDEVCTHKERIYVSNLKSENRMEVYNPVANKWNIIPYDPWSIKLITNSHRLASFKNKLWMFITINREENFSLSNEFQWYDSFTEEWNKAPPFRLPHSYIYKRIADLIVYKP